MNRPDLLEMKILARDELLTIIDQGDPGKLTKDQFFLDALEGDCKIRELLRVEDLQKKCKFLKLDT